MLFRKLFFSVLIAFCCLNSYCAVKPYKIKKGFWTANLQLNDSTYLPFKLEITYQGKIPVLIVHNAQERIELISKVLGNDSIQADFPQFHSYLRFAAKSKSHLSGYWHNLNKTGNYRLHFEAMASYSDGMPAHFYPIDLSGKYKTTFSPGTSSEDLAIGLFSSNQYQFTGTFVTETGDYRYLSGKAWKNPMGEDEFYLSRFDGSWAFLFKGQVKQGVMDGHYYSGKHYHTNWNGQADPNFELRNPDSLTYLTNADLFRFSALDLDGASFNFPNSNYNNKVVIIQIMGTWCPNCLDETRFLMEVYKKYKQDGLEIISVGFETPSEFAQQREKIELLKKRLNPGYALLIGGQANKANASKVFPMLNEVMSYPTAIYINRKGEVAKIHTGFNGPGTGDLYQEYVKETERFIQQLLGNQ